VESVTLHFTGFVAAVRFSDLQPIKMPVTAPASDRLECLIGSNIVGCGIVLRCEQGRTETGPPLFVILFD